MHLDNLNLSAGQIRDLLELSLRPEWPALKLALSRLEDAVTISAFAFETSEQAFENRGKVQTIRQVNELLTSIWERAANARTGATVRRAEEGTREISGGTSRSGEDEELNPADRVPRRPAY